MRRSCFPILLTLVLAAGCKKDAPSDRGAESGRSSIAIATFEPPALDPHKLGDSVGAIIAINLFEGLTTRSADGSPTGGAAERWTISKDRRTWTFFLRKGLTWSDGTPLTADDFVWSLRRSMAQATGNRNAPMLWPISGAEAFNKGDITDPTKVGLAADGEKVVITLERPYPRLLKVLALASALPVPRHVVEKHPDTWTRPEHVVSNGAYTLSAHKHGQTIVLKRNDRFHGASSVALTEATFHFTTDSPTALRWYKLGKIDWSAGLIPADAMEQMKRDNAPELRIDDFGGLFFLYVNASKPPFDDALVRRAIDLAIDRRKLTRQLLGGGQKPADSPIPPSMTAARSPRRVRHDPEAARKLLTQAGYTADRPMPEVELIYNSNDRNKALASFLARDLKEALGITVAARNLDWKTFLAELGTPGYSMAQLGMGGFDAMDFLGLVRGDSADNRARWVSAEYDALIDKAREAGTIEAQDAVIGEALKLFDAQMPVIPLYRMTRQTLLRPGITGYEATEDNVHPLRWLAWE